MGGYDNEIEDARSIIKSASTRKQSILDKYLNR